MTPFKPGVALLAMCCGPLFAQSDGLNEVTAPETVITATRFPESAADGPLEVTVITAEQIARSPATTLPDLLALEAGIQTRDLYGNNAAAASVDLRGFGAGASENTLILVDGRRLNDIDLSGVQWSSVPLTQIERVEIVRGSGAVQYGDGATTGVVNIITRSPAAQSSASGRIAFGSYDLQNFEASGTLAGDDTGLSLGGTYFHSNGYRENNQANTGTAYLDARWLRSQWALAFKANLDRENLRLPGARTVQPSAGIDQLASDRRGTSTPLDFSTRDGRRAAVELDYQAPRFDLNLGLGYRAKDQTSYFDFSGFPDYREIDLGVWSLTPRVRVPFELGGTGGALVAGIDWYRWSYELDVSNSEANIGQPINQIDATQDNLAVYLRLTAEPRPGTSVAAGGRYERQRIDAQDIFDPSAPGAAFGSGAAPASQTVREPAWEVALRQALTSSVAARARIGTAFRFATVDEIYEFSGPPTFSREFQFLQPQTSFGYDLGLEYSAQNWSASATLFQLDVENEIHLDPYTTGVGNTNLPESRRRGVELAARWQPLPSLSVQGRYTYIDARFTGGGDTAFAQGLGGKTVPLVPISQASAVLAWQIAQSWRMTAAARYASSQFMDNDETNSLGVKIPAYTVADLRLDFLRGGWTLSAAVDNVFGTAYYTYAVRSQFVSDRYNAYPLPERTFWLAAHYRFP